MSTIADRSDRAPLHIKLLGGFSIKEEGPGEKWNKMDTGGRSKRLWSIIEYLIVYRWRDITSEELFNVFWDKETDDPQRTLRNTINRCRDILEAAGISGARELLISVGGRYTWNNDRITYVDIEEFEKLAKAASAASDIKQKLRLGTEAIALYDGDIWSGKAGGDWVNPLAAYYHSLYADLNTAVIKCLWEENRWLEVVQICEKALEIEPGLEDSSTYFMRALTALKQPQKALDYYDFLKNYYKKEYGITPSEEIELARAEAAQSLTRGEVDFTDVMSYLRETEKPGGAFLCDYSVFRRVVILQTRLAKRTGSTVPIVILRIIPQTSKSGSSPVTTEMKRMEKTLLNTLRSGDAFTRLSATQFLIMLPNASQENVGMIMTRVESAFRKAYPRSKALMKHFDFPISTLFSDNEAEA